MDFRGVLYGSSSMILVGSSVAAASLLVDYPVLGGQGVRFAAASLLLLLWVRVTKQPIPKPSKVDLAWLSAVALVGMVLFNVLLILSTDRIDPALVGAIIGTAPIVLAIAGALQLGRNPRGTLVAAAVMVTIGTALVVQARVEGDAVGVTFAIGAMLAEVGFSLLAVPVLKTIGPVGVSLHVTWIAAVMLLVGAVGLEGSAALRMPTSTELWALAFLAVLVTAVAFVLWYSAVDRLGAETAGLFAGFIPVSALLTSAMLGTDSVTPVKIAGVLIVGLGVAFGMRTGGYKPDPVP